MKWHADVPSLRKLKGSLYDMVHDLTEGNAPFKSIPFKHHGRRYTIRIVQLETYASIKKRRKALALIKLSKQKMADEIKVYTPGIEDVQFCFTCHGPTFGGVCLTRGCPLASPPNPQ